MKIIGANIIALGIMSLAFAVCGLQIGVLFFLDVFGPVAGYVLKIGLIALGVWIWRKDEQAADEMAVEENGEVRRGWIPVTICALVVAGAIGTIVVRSVGEKRLASKLESSVVAAEWAAWPKERWPGIVLLQEAEFVHHTGMQAGCASLVRLPTGEIVALTAGHLLGRDGGVSPGFYGRGLRGWDTKALASLSTEIKSWKLYAPDDDKIETLATGLYGDARKFDEYCDQVLLSLSQEGASHAATALNMRLTPVGADEALYVVTLEMDDEGEIRQAIHEAKRMPGPVFTCAFERPVQLTGASGSPIVDKNGLLVGIVTGKTLMDLGNPGDFVRSCTAHSVMELMPVIKSAVAEKGVASPAQTKTVIRKPGKRSVPSNETPPIASTSA